MAILVFLFRIRVVVLVVLTAATAAAAYFAFHGQPIPVGALFLSTPSLAIGAVISFVHLRHGGLAVVATLSPLPGMVAAGLFAVPAGLTLAGLVAVYGFAYAAGVLLSGDIVRGLLDGQDRVDAAREAFARALTPSLLATLTACALLIGWLFRDARMLSVAAAAEMVGATTSTILFTAFAAAVLPAGETFIANANRARERRERFVRLAAMALEPRWGLSLAGAALVLATLGGFGVGPLLARSALLAQPALWGASALLIFLILFAATRDWRDALAASLSLATLALVALWVWGAAVGHLTLTSFIEIVAVIAVGLMGAAALLGGARRYRRSGDDVAIARLRGVEEAATSVAFAAAGTAGAILPWILLHGSMASLAALFVLAGAAALVGTPAISTALDALVRRRRSAQELYGRG